MPLSLSFTYVWFPFFLLPSAQNSGPILVETIGVTAVMALACWGAAPRRCSAHAQTLPSRAVLSSTTTRSTRPHSGKKKKMPLFGFGNARSTHLFIAWTLMFPYEFRQQLYIISHPKRPKKNLWNFEIFNYFLKVVFFLAEFRDAVPRAINFCALRNAQRARGAGVFRIYVRGR